jgi:predicted PurR-regulated permease PerM
MKWWMYLVYYFIIYLSNRIQNLTMISSKLLILCVVALFVSLVYTGSVYAQIQTQNQSSSQNETMATVTDRPQSVVANQTTIPAEQTTVTVTQTTKPITDQSQLQPLQNQTISSQTGNLSNIENKTMVQATGLATTIIANKTTVPFNQTTIDIGNMTNSQSLSTDQPKPSRSSLIVELGSVII